MKRLDLSTIKLVKDYLRQSTDLNDFRVRVHTVRDTNNGYPDFWWLGIVKSGFYDSVVNKWGADSKMRITYPDGKTEVVE